MKKFLVPSLLMLFAAGLGQQNAKAGSFSIGISIGDDHRYHAPAVVVSRPPVACAPAPVVVVQPRPVDYPGYYVRECERRPVYYGYGNWRDRRWDDRYRHDHRHEGYGYRR